MVIDFWFQLLDVRFRVLFDVLFMVHVVRIIVAEFDWFHG